MKTWLFTWNPSRWAWDSRYDGFLEMKNQIAQADVSYRTWSCGNNKSIKKGDRIFLIRLGVAPKGIVASGYAASNVFEGPHWDIEKDLLGKKCRRIFIEFDKIQDVAKDSIISMDELLGISPTYKWASQTSGIEIPNHMAEKLDILWKQII